MIYDVTFENFKNTIYNYNKIVICSFDENSKKYYYQDILDLNDLKYYKYHLRVNNNIYLIPQKNINTYLYSFDNTSKQSNLKYDDSNMNIMKYENIPKYSWNIGYDGNKYLLLSEEDNQVYNIIEQNNLSDSIKQKYNINKKIQAINQKDNKIINFINGTGNNSSFVFNEKGDLFIVDEKRKKYAWLNDKEKEKIENPISIQGIKIVNISANNRECYAIGENGNLYESKGQNFKKISQPKNTKKFLQCVCGEGYVICLLENNKNKGVLYAKGTNFNYQLGINQRNNYSGFLVNTVKELTKCQFDEDLDFKFINTCNQFSAAITSCGKLFVWGFVRNVLIESPLLVNKGKYASILVDKIFLNYNNLLVIGRSLKNGNYISKLFYPLKLKHIYLY